MSNIVERIVESVSDAASLDSPLEVLEALGFEVDYRWEEYNEAYSTTFKEDDAALEAWNPDCPEGYEFCMKYISDDLEFTALFVKPQTDLAKRLWSIAKGSQKDPANH